MNRIIVFLVALFFTASAFAQTCYDPDEDMYYNCGDDSSYYYPDNGVTFGFFLPFGGYNNGGYYHHGGGYYHGGGYHGGGYHGGGYHGGGGHHH